MEYKQVLNLYLINNPPIQIEDEDDELQIPLRDDERWNLMLALRLQDDDEAEEDTLSGEVDGS